MKNLDYTNKKLKLYRKTWIANRKNFPDKIFSIPDRIEKRKNL
jgi:hypothetical protein